MELIYILLILIYVSGCFCYKEGHKFKRDEYFVDQICHQHYIAFEAEVRSAINCVKLCSTRPGCQGVTYHPGGRLCYGVNESYPFNETFALLGAVFYKANANVTSASTIPTTTTTTTTATAASTTTTPTAATPTPITAAPMPATTSVATTTTTTSNGCPVSDLLFDAVPDAGFIASSEISVTYAPHKSRLTNTESCWTPNNNNPSNFIQVDFGVIKRVVEVITAGDPGYPEWVTSYSLQYSTDCASFLEVLDGVGNLTIFPANFDNMNHVTNMLEPPLDMRCLQLHPETYSTYTSLRWDARGCTPSA